MTDQSTGWDAVADRFVALRSNVGADIALRWSRHVRPGGAILDIGCGTGIPIARVLREEGFALFGIDPSPTLLAAFRRNLPDAAAAQETAEASGFFGRRFDGIVAVGLMFLLSEEAQGVVIARVEQALQPGGQFLFSAPPTPCVWSDNLTGRASRSLGKASYVRLLAGAGMTLIAEDQDGGGNHYFHAASLRGQAESEHTSWRAPRPLPATRSSRAINRTQ